MEKIRCGEAMLYSCKRTIQLINIIVLIIYILLWWISTYQFTTSLLPTCKLPAHPPFLLMFARWRRKTFPFEKESICWSVCLDLRCPSVGTSDINTGPSFPLNTHNHNFAMLLVSPPQPPSRRKSCLLCTILLSTVNSSIGQIFMKQNLLYGIFKYSR